MSPLKTFESRYERLVFSLLPTTSQILFADDAHLEYVFRMRGSSSLTDEQRTFRRILLAKGPVVTPRKIQMSFHGRLKVSDVLQAMEQMSELGFGVLCQYQSSSNKFFQKADPDRLDDKALLTYNVTAYEYRRNYFFRK